MKIKNVFFALLAVSNICWANVVELVVPWAPGGPTDQVAQIIVMHAKPEFAKHKMSLNIVYKPGAAGIVGANSVAANADGNMQILLAGNTVVSTPIINPSIVSYDISKDFTTLGYVGHASMVTVVNSSSKIKSLGDLKKECQKNNLNYGTAGEGSNTHISSAILNSLIGCKATPVPYKGMGPAITDLIGGHIDYITDYENSALIHIKNNKLTAIVILDKNRSSNLPGVATIYENGHHDYNYYNWIALLSNSNADTIQLSIAEQIFSTLLKSSEVINQLNSIGVKGQKQIPKNFLITERQKFLQILNNATITK